MESGYIEKGPHGFEEQLRTEVQCSLSSVLEEAIPSVSTDFNFDDLLPDHGVFSPLDSNDLNLDLEPVNEHFGNFEVINNRNQNCLSLENCENLKLHLGEGFDRTSGSFASRISIGDIFKKVLEEEEENSVGAITANTRGTGQDSAVFFPAKANTEEPLIYPSYTRYPSFPCSPENPIILGGITEDPIRFQEDKENLKEFYSGKYNSKTLQSSKEKAQQSKVGKMLSRRRVVRCRQCKVTCQNETLGQHMRDLHILLRCAMCSFTSYFVNGIKGHMKLHPGSRVFWCVQCDLGFFVDWKYEVHMNRVHSCW